MATLRTTTRGTSPIESPRRTASPRRHQRRSRGRGYGRRGRRRGPVRSRGRPLARSRVARGWRARDTDRLRQAAARARRARRHGPEPRPEHVGVQPERRAGSTSSSPDPPPRTSSHAFAGGARLKPSKRPRRSSTLRSRPGDAVDGTIAQLLPLLEPGDIVIDGGNSNFDDFSGAAGGSVSAGCCSSAQASPEARKGRATDRRWRLSRGLAPRPRDLPVDSRQGRRRTPCCDWVGEDGAGHYVKMVQRDRSTGDMQVIAEAYDLLRSMRASPTTSSAPSSTSGTAASSTPTWSRSRATSWRSAPRTASRSSRGPRHRRPEGDGQVDGRSLELGSR